MRDHVILFVHLIVTLARLAGPGGIRSVVAESVLVKQQLLILNRLRQRSRGSPWQSTLKRDAQSRVSCPLCLKPESITGVISRDPRCPTPIYPFGEAPPASTAANACFPECHPFTVLLPESFRGGCSFGAIRAPIGPRTISPAKVI